MYSLSNFVEKFDFFDNFYRKCLPNCNSRLESEITYVFIS